MEIDRDPKGYYLALGVEPDDSDKKISSSYKKRKKRLKHNNRPFSLEFLYSVGWGDLVDIPIMHLRRRRRTAEDTDFNLTLQARLDEAYAVVGDPQKRAEYDPFSVVLNPK